MEGGVILLPSVGKLPWLGDDDGGLAFTGCG